jgi:hypothetical protein
LSQFAVGDMVRATRFANRLRKISGGFDDPALWHDEYSK